MSELKSHFTDCFYGKSGEQGAIGDKCRRGPSFGWFTNVYIGIDFGRSFGEKKIKVCFFEKELRLEISKRTRICSLKWPIGSGGNKNKDHKNHRIFFETQPSFLSTESSENEELLLFSLKTLLTSVCSKCPFVRSSRRSPVVGLKRGTASQVSVIFGFYLSSSF